MARVKPPRRSRRPPRGKPRQPGKIRGPKTLDLGRWRSSSLAAWGVGLPGNQLGFAATAARGERDIDMPRSPSTSGRSAV